MESPKSEANSLAETPIDKLLTIKAFQEKQLLDFYQNTLFDSNEKFIENFVEKYANKHRNDYFELILRLVKSGEKFSDTKNLVDELWKSTEKLEQNCWNPSITALTQTKPCSDGQSLDETIEFTTFTFNQNSCKDLERYYYILRDRILNDHAVHSFYKKFYQLQFEILIYQMCENVKKILENLALAEDESEPLPEDRMAKEELLDWIAALFSYYRKTEHVNPVIKQQCYDCILFLSNQLFKIATFEDRLFLLNHILRCSQSSAQLACLIQCPNPLQLKQSNYDSGLKLVDFGVTVISTILSPIVDRDKFLEMKNSKQNSTDQIEPWILIDTELEEELLIVSPNSISENDIILYLEQVPFEQMLEFMSILEEDRGAVQSTEASMIRLFAFNTRLIRILKNSLQNFNCLRYKQLTLYIASLIRKIITKNYQNWNWCKRNFTTKDQALLIRLQVEFDNFMLRSIIAILSTNRRGVWPLLAQIDFVGISEPMLWHILWVVYSNGHDELHDQSSGLSPYMSINYWKDKYSKHSRWKFVFMEKLAIFSAEEAGGLLQFLYNMSLCSDEKQSKEFLVEIITRLFEICLCKQPIPVANSPRHIVDSSLGIKNQSYYTEKGFHYLVKLLNRFRSLISILLQLIDKMNNKSDCFVEPCLKIFKELNFTDWIPSDSFYEPIYNWLMNKDCDHFHNQIARIILSRLDWNKMLLQDNRCLLINREVQRDFALKIFTSVIYILNRKFLETNDPKADLLNNFKYPCLKREQNLLELASMTDLNSFICWCWSMLLRLRIHPLDFVPNESKWDDIVFGTKPSSIYKNRLFHNLPQLNFDIELVQLNNYVGQQNPIALYVAAMMTDFLHQNKEIDRLLQVAECLAAKGHYMPLTNLLYYTIPANISNWTILKGSVKFISLLVTLLQNGFHEELCSVILLHLKHFDVSANCIQIYIGWTEILFEVLKQCLRLKSSSWFSSQSSLVAAIDQLIEHVTAIFDQIAMQLLLHDDSILFHQYVEYLAERDYADIQSWKLNNLDTVSNSSSSWSIFSLAYSWSSAEQIVDYLPDKSVLKSEWLTPFHVMLRQSLNRQAKRKDSSTLPVYLSVVLIEIDTRRTAKIWDHLIYRLNTIVAQMEEPTLSTSVVEAELKQVCELMDEKTLIPFSLMPINTLTVWLLRFSQTEALSIDQPHPMLPFLWKNFFILYFSNSGSSPSIGYRFLNRNLSRSLETRLVALYDFHSHARLKLDNNRKVDGDTSSIAAILHQERMVKLYKSYRLWLSDSRLHSSFLDLDEEQFALPEYQSSLLKMIFADCCATLKNTQLLQTKSNNTSSIDTFFVLNYLNKTSLREKLFQLETLWFDLVKSEIGTRSEQPKVTSEEKRSTSDLKNELPCEKIPTEFSDGQFKQEIEYFSTLTEELNENLLLVHNDFTMNPQCHQSVMPFEQQDISIVIVIIHQLIDTIMAEAKFVDSQLKKYNQLCEEFQKDLLPKLYTAVNKKILKKVKCQRDEFDAAGCTGAAVFEFKFVDSELNNYIKQKYDANRFEFNAAVRSLTEDILKSRVIGSVFFLQKIINYLWRFFDGDPHAQCNQTKLEQLFKAMTGWINQINSVPKYHVTSQVLDQFLVLLNQLSTTYMDEINHFILETSLKQNITTSMIQQLAPYLTPSHCSPHMFIEMYQLISLHLNTSAQQTVFVLLSKFDVLSWLELSHVTDQQRYKFLDYLFHSLGLFGINPSDENLITFDLYRKHLQDIMLYRFPMFFPKVLDFMHQGMNNSILAPGLWNSVLQTFGFYTTNLSFNIKVDSQTQSKEPVLHSSIIDFDHKAFDQVLRTYTEGQTILSSHEIYDLLQIMITFTSGLEQELKVEFLDHFKSYITKYLQFVSFMSYCWFYSNKESDDVATIWKAFFESWKVWIFPKRSTKFISIQHLNFAWQLYINCVQFVTDCFPGHCSQFLSCLWQTFLSFIIESRSIETEDVAILEEKLLQLTTWSSFNPDLEDIRLMYESLIQNHYSVEKLNAYVISKINWHKSLMRTSFSYEELITVVQNLSYVLIMLADQTFIAPLNFNTIPFVVLNASQTKQVTATLLQVIQQKKSSQPAEILQENTLFKLLQAVCLIRNTTSPAYNGFGENLQQNYPNEVGNLSDKCWLFDKHIVYANCIALLISSHCNSSPEFVAKNPDRIRQFLQNTIETMKVQLDQFETKQRVQIFSEFLNAINGTFSEPIRKKLCVYFVTIFSYFHTSSLLAEVIVAVNNTIHSVKSATYLLENFIENYLDLRGDVKFVLENLSIMHLNGIQQTLSQHDFTLEDLIFESIQTRATFLLLVHFYSRLHKRTVPEVCTRKYILTIITQSVNHFKSCLNQFSSESKILLFWTQTISLLTESGPELDYRQRINISVYASIESTSQPTLDVNNEEMLNSIKTLFHLCKSMHASISDCTNRGFLGYFKSTKQPSNWCLFIMECLVAHGTCALLETFFENLEDLDSSKSALYSDSIRSRLGKEISDLQKSSISRLKSWRKDKSFVDIWTYIDDLFQLVDSGEIKNNSADFLDSQSFDDTDSLSNSLTDGIKQTKHWTRVAQFQSKRFESIQNWLLTFYSDKGFMKAFLKMA